MDKHRNGLAYGTVRRAPAPSFAHAILLDQFDRDSWHVVDLYGPISILGDAEVANWPIVYTPMDDEKWETRDA